MAETLPIGAHLTTPRRYFIHHGIYAGNNYVIHYRGFTRRLRREPVEIVTLEQFADGYAVTVKPWVAPKFSAAEIVARARSRLGERRYRLWSNNCEHFCEWCISGTSRSAQVDAYRSWLQKVFVPLKAAPEMRLMRDSKRAC